MSLQDLGSQQLPQVPAGSTLRHTVRAAVTGWPAPTTLAWTGGGISDRALRSHFDDATPVGRTRTFEFHLERSVTGTTVTQTYTLTATKRFTSATARLSLQWA